MSQAQLAKLNRMLLGDVQPGRDDTRKSSWYCGLNEMILGEYLIIPLTSARKLRSEGYCMNNCCRDYIEPCAAGQYSVFSIRSRSGERLATLGMAKDGERWHLDQCYGPSNSEVLEEDILYEDEEGILQVEPICSEMYYLAHEVVRLMNSEKALMTC